MTHLQLPDRSPMSSVLLTSFSIAGFVILAVSIRQLFDPKRGIQKRWEGAVRHTVAIAIALCALVVLFTLLQLLDLFESNLYSLDGFFDILQFSLALLVGGGMIVAVALVIVLRY